MKPSQTTRSPNRTGRSVAWWSTLLLIALGAVLAALFLSARLVLSPANEQGLEQTSAANRAPLLAHVTHVSAPRNIPNRSEPSNTRLVAFVEIVLA